MKTVKFLFTGGLVLLMVTSCAYRHYLGMHGPSIRRFPDVHAEAAEDGQCLACHHPDRDPVGPPTSHPQFVGCLKCHNDPLTKDFASIRFWLPRSNFFRTSRNTE